MWLTLLSKIENDTQKLSILDSLVKIDFRVIQLTDCILNLSKIEMNMVICKRFNSLINLFTVINKILKKNKSYK